MSGLRRKIHGVAKDAIETAEVASQPLNDLLCVGDTVVIQKPKTINRAHQFSWDDDMNEYDGCTASIKDVLEKVDDNEIQAYGLDIDGDMFGWIKTWLTKIDT